MKDHRFFVYEHWRPDTGECFYVGKGSGGRAKCLFRSKHHRNIVLKLRRMGLAVERRIIRDGLAEEEALALEMELIAKYGRRDLGSGPLTNRTAGGDGTRGMLVSAETRKKHAERMMGNTHTLGYRANEETKKLLSKIHKGKKFTAEHKAKIGAGHKGKTVSQETREKMAAARKTWWVNATEDQRTAVTMTRKGKVISLEQRKKISVFWTGRRHRPETIAKMRRARIAWYMRKREGVAA